MNSYLKIAIKSGEILMFIPLILPYQTFLFQIQDLNSTIREKEKEIIDLKKNLEEKTSEISTLKNGSPALKHQIESAAQREAELDQRITMLGMTPEFEPWQNHVF